MTKRGFIDGETYSTVDLRKKGLHLYAEHPDTNVWCVCFAIDDGPIGTWLPPQPCPPALVQLVRSGGELWAHNAAFEREIWTRILTPRYGWPLPRYEQWHCTLAAAYAMALPGALDSASNALGLTLAKDADGYALMLRMARPRRYDDNGRPVWWNDDPARLAKLVAYCQQDVEVERAIHGRLIELRAQERQVWLLDQIINDRGILIDRPLCETAKALVEAELKVLNREIVEVSDRSISTVNTVAQISAYCRDQGVDDVTSIAADAVEKLLVRDDLPEKVRRVLEIREQASLSSVKKIEALLQGACADGRVRGLLQYHAASTGRFAGRRFQPQNLKRPVNHNQDQLIELIRTGKASIIKMLAGSVLEVVSDVLRGLIVAAPGQAFYAADYSNIEGRVMAWLAGETWKIDAFEAYDMGEGPDIYKLAYARSFHIPIEAITSEQRQVGKVLELSLQYQGGRGAFQTMARGYGVKVSDQRADALKDAWREAHPRVVALWPQVEKMAIRAVDRPDDIIVCGKLSFRKAGSFLFMRLPSGRLLTYPYPKVMNLPTPWGEQKRALTFKSQINPSNAGQVIEDPGNSKNWARISTYGGMLAANSVQAIARDIMVQAMLRVEAAGYPLVLTVHDELVSEAPAGRDIAKFRELMEARPQWGADIPIVAKAWTGDRYRKD